MTDTPTADMAAAVIEALAGVPGFNKAREDAIEAMKSPTNVGFAVFIKEAGGEFRSIACCDHAHLAGISIAAAKRASDGY